MLSSAKAGLVLASAFSLALGQNTMSVQVGSFYSPNFLAGRNGDIVEFTFTFGRHGVTQSTFDNPCSQAAGGFNSGLISGFAANDTFSSPTWSLTITNESEPIYFYCQAMVPSFHCSSGMVGGINVPADEFSSFSDAAKAMTSTPAQTTSAVLSGIGATAVALPTTIINSAALTSTVSTTASTSSSTSSSSTSAFPSQTSAAPAPKSSSNTGAIVGGAVGGSAAVAIIAILVFLLLRQRNNHKQAPSSLYSPETSQRGGYDAMNAKPFIAPQGTGGSDGNPFASGVMPTMAFDQAGMGHLRNQGSMPTMIPPGLPGIHNTAQIHSSSNIPSEANRNTSYTASSAISSDPTYAEPPLTGQSFLPLIPPSMPSSTSETNRSSHYTTDVFSMAGASSAGSNVPGQHAVPVPPQSPPLPPVVSEKPAVSNMDVKEIAKEVASLLAPHLQGAAAPTAGAPGQDDPSPANQKRPLPNPFPKAYESERPQAQSPGPPQYERYDQ